MIAFAIKLEVACGSLDLIHSKLPKAWVSCWQCGVCAITVSTECEQKHNVQQSTERELCRVSAKHHAGVVFLLSQFPLNASRDTIYNSPLNVMMSSFCSTQCRRRVSAIVVSTECEQKHNMSQSAEREQCWVLPNTLRTSSFCQTHCWRRVSAHIANVVFLPNTLQVSCFWKTSTRGCLLDPESHVSMPRYRVADTHRIPYLHRSLTRSENTCFDR